MLCIRSEVEYLTTAMDAIEHKSVLHWGELFNQKFDGLLSGDSSHVGAHIVQFSHAEAKNFSQVLLFNWLLLHSLCNFIALCPHESILVILVIVVLTEIVTLGSQAFEALHCNQPLNTAFRLIKVVRNIAPIWLIHFILNRVEFDEIEPHYILLEQF